MLRISVVLLLIAILTAVVGFYGIAGIPWESARLFAAGFALLAFLTFLSVNGNSWRVGGVSGYGRSRWDVLLELRQMEKDILTRGKVDTLELEELRQRVYDLGKVGRGEANFLVGLHKRVPHRTPAFDKFFYRAIKDHLLTDGRLNAEAVAWLREMVLADGKVDDEERKLLRELRGEAREISREFETLFAKCMRQPQEQHTSG